MGMGPVRSFLSAFDSFVFKSFDMLGRSTRMEYWCVMPVVWTTMIGLLWWDGRGFWSRLEAGEMPSLNPLAYGSVLFVLISAIPRLTLAMRRLQDSGRKGKWAFLPYSAGFLALMAVFGLATSGAFSMTSDDGGIGAQISLAMMFASGSAEGFVLGLYHLINNIDSIQFVGQMPNASQFVEGMADNGMGGPAMAIPMLLILGIMFLYPPLAIFIYLLFMTLASQEGENAYGQPSTFGRGPKVAPKGEHNAFASYAVLTKQGRKPTESEIAARKETVHSLYEQRVLGRQRENASERS